VNLIETTPSVSPDGARVAFGRTDVSVPLIQRQSDVFSIGLDGMNEATVAATPAVNEISPAYSPDGTKIV
jgi:Tol biopolymer transport system component